MKTSQYIKALTKCNKVLNSCTRNDQLPMAKEYCNRFIGYCRSSDKKEQSQNPMHVIWASNYFVIIDMVKDFNVNSPS